MNQYSTAPMETLLNNLSVIANKYFQIYQKLVNKKRGEAIPDPLQLNKLMLKLFNKVFSDPELIIKYQMSFFRSQLETIENVCNRFYSDNFLEMDKKQNTDKRFKDNVWEEHCVFVWFKEAYFTYADWLEKIIKELPEEEFNTIEIRRLNFIIKQFLDAIAPSNFPSTNPEVLKTFFDTAGGNFIKGLDNLLQDIENSKQTIQIRTTDNSKFSLGENIANTPGKVVYQNEIMQLIHYKPTEKSYYSVPILIVPPFINKYYVLDLQPENSLVKWLLEQNYNVFLISWVNPNEALAKATFVDYMAKGPIAAIDYISKALKVDKVNAMGYCIGGTLLSATLAYMKTIKDNRVKTATFLTTLIDFEDAGDLSIFVDDHSIEEIGRYMELSGGFLEGSDMSVTFNLLRSNDMIWPFYINNYLLGRETFPFNLLYWNSDSVRLPMELNLFYLKNMYKDNLLKVPGAIVLNGKPIDISSIDIPCFVLATKGDHIVPWHNAFNSAKLFTGPVIFVLSESGHVAGVVNHPSQNKYGYWKKNLEAQESSEQWLKKATETQGSWWLCWNEWAKTNSGKMELAKSPEAVNANIIEDAPGSYVRVRY